jgi:hypothetical protein
MQAGEDVHLRGLAMRWDPLHHSMRWHVQNIPAGSIQTVPLYVIISNETGGSPCGQAVSSAPAVGQRRLPQAGRKPAAAAGQPDGQAGCLVTGTRPRGMRAARGAEAS